MANIHPVPSPSMVATDLPDGIAPVEGPAVQADQHIESAPPGTDHDAGSNDTISASVQGAVMIALARLADLQAETLTQGSTIGDTMPLPVPPIQDETVLGYVKTPNMGGLGQGLDS